MKILLKIAVIAVVAGLVGCGQSVPKCHDSAVTSGIIEAAGHNRILMWEGINLDINKTERRIQSYNPPASNWAEVYDNQIDSLQIELDVANKQLVEWTMFVQNKIKNNPSWATVINVSTLKFSMRPDEVLDRAEAFLNADAERIKQLVLQSSSLEEAESLIDRSWMGPFLKESTKNINRTFIRKDWLQSGRKSYADYGPFERIQKKATRNFISEMSPENLNPESGWLYIQKFAKQKYRLAKSIERQQAYTRPTGDWSRVNDNDYFHLRSELSSVNYVLEDWIFFVHNKIRNNPVWATVIDVSTLKSSMSPDIVLDRVEKFLNADAERVEQLVRKSNKLEEAESIISRSWMGPFLKETMKDINRNDYHKNWSQETRKIYADGLFYDRQRKAIKNFIKEITPKNGYGYIGSFAEQKHRLLKSIEYIQADKKNALARIESSKAEQQKRKDSLPSLHKLLKHIEEGKFTISNIKTQFANEASGQSYCTADLTFAGFSGVVTTSVEYRIGPSDNSELNMQISGLAGDIYFP